MGTKPPISAEIVINADPFWAIVKSLRRMGGLTVSP